MASRAFLASVSRVSLNYHYAMQSLQSRFIEDELEESVERPLRLLHVVAHSTATNLFQFLQYNGPTAFHSVVHAFGPAKLYEKPQPSDRVFSIG
jgi:hypothetical protein